MEEDLKQTLTSAAVPAAAPDVSGTEPAETAADIRLYSPLVLAYIGDAVYEVYVRNHLIRTGGNQPVEKLHKKATCYVKAAAQAAAAEHLHPQWTEEEQDIYRRGRNAKSHTLPKNADPGDYRRATGFEAVMGWLSLKGENDRLQQLMEAAVTYLEEENKR